MAPKPARTAPELVRVSFAEKDPQIDQAGGITQETKDGTMGTGNSTEVTKDVTEVTILFLSLNEGFLGIE